MFDRLLALASAAGAVEANAAGGRADVDPARIGSAGARFASAVETSGATTEPSDVEPIADRLFDQLVERQELRDSDRTTASADLGNAKPGEHSASGFGGVRGVQVSRQEHSRDEVGERPENVRSRDITDADNVGTSHQVTQPGPRTSARRDKAMGSDTEPDEDRDAEAGRNKRRLEGKGIEEEKNEAGGRSKKKRRTTERVALSKRDRIVSVVQSAPLAAF